jgi:hypothetical protein
MGHQLVPASYISQQENSGRINVLIFIAGLQKNFISLIHLSIQIMDKKKTPRCGSLGSFICNASLNTATCNITGNYYIGKINNSLFPYLFTYIFLKYY